MANYNTKQNDAIMHMNENFIWVTIIMIGLMTYYKGTGHALLLIFWIPVLLFAGNAQRVHSDKHENMAMLFRRSLYIIPLAFPLLIGVSFQIYPEMLNLVVWILVSVCAGILFILPKYRTWQLTLSYDMIGFACSKQSKLDYITFAVLLVLTPVFEEFFYRGFVISNTASSIGWGSVFFSAYLFVMHHYGIKWSNVFKKYDLIIQFLFGLTSGAIFYLSKSIVPCIIAHLVYNSPHILYNIRNYRYFYCNVHESEATNLKSE